MLKHIFTLIWGSSFLLTISLSGAFNKNIVQAETIAVSPQSAKINGLVVYSSPAIADLNNDGRQEIIVGTQTGYLVAMQYNNNGSFDLRWEKYLGASIGSSPAVGDVDGDGDLEIAIGVGWAPDSQAGAIVLLDHNGNQLWRKQTGDRNGGANGIPDGVFSTPALGDLNNNGCLEIVIAGFDENIYALDANGNNLPGFPVWMQDNTWSSPALGDIDKDGYLDVIVGAYANLHTTPCPDYACGRMFVINHEGQSLPGWPRMVDSHLDSTPLVFDLDNDGQLEIVIGSGRNLDLPDRFNKVYAFEANGNFMSGWPRTTGGYVFASPAAADVDGDGDYEVFVGANDGKLYGWSHSGQNLSGWPVTPKNQNGDIQGVTGAVSPTIVDADGDGQLEIFITSGWDIVGFEKSGALLSDSYRFKSFYSIGATPVWGDIDNDGNLEVTIANGHYSDADAGFGRINVWDLNTNEDENGLAWPMWRKNIQRTGLGPVPPSLSVNSSELLTLTQKDTRSDVMMFFKMNNPGDASLNYTINKSSALITVAPATGVLASHQEKEIAVIIDTTTLSTPGRYDYELTIHATDGQNPLPGSPFTLPVTVVIANEIHQVYLPSIVKP